MSIPTKTAILFSGGPDSLSAYYHHMAFSTKEEKPSLIYFPNTVRSTATGALGDLHGIEIPEHINKLLNALKETAYLAPNHRLFVFENQETFELPGRHIYFSTTAANMGARKIIFGIEAGLDHGAVDRSPEFFKSMEDILTAAFREKVSIESNIFGKTKTVAIYDSILLAAPTYGLETVVDTYNMSESCYKPPKNKAFEVTHCGTCDACIRRFVAFELANLKLLQTDTHRYHLLRTDNFVQEPMFGEEIKEYLNRKNLPMQAVLDNDRFERLIYSKAMETRKQISIKFEMQQPKVEQDLAPVISYDQHIRSKAKGIGPLSSFMAVKFSKIFLSPGTKNISILSGQLPGTIPRDLAPKTYVNFICVISAGNVQEFIKCLHSFELLSEDARKETLLLIRDNSGQPSKEYYGEIFSIITTGTHKGKKVINFPLPDCLITTADHPTTLPSCRKIFVHLIDTYFRRRDLADRQFILFMDDDVYAKGVVETIGLCRFHYNSLRFKYKKDWFPILFGHQISLFKTPDRYLGELNTFSYSEGSENVGKVDNKTTGVVSIRRKSVMEKYGNISVHGHFMCMPLSTVKKLNLNTGIYFWYEDTLITHQVNAAAKYFDNKYSKSSGPPCLALVSESFVEHAEHQTQKSTGLYDPDLIAHDLLCYEKTLMTAGQL